MPGLRGRFWRSLAIGAYGFGAVGVRRAAGLVAGSQTDNLLVRLWSTKSVVLVLALAMVFGLSAIAVVWRRRASLREAFIVLGMGLFVAGSALAIRYAYFPAPSF